MLLIAAICRLVTALSPLEQSNFTPHNISVLRNKTVDLFFHSWNAYRDHALPMDELRPLSCEGVGPDPDVTHLQRNDIMGNFSITLLDTLDMFAILGEDDLFEYYVEYVKNNVHFDQPSIVQVFEITIRAMGGLLSAHMYASVPELGHAIPGYDGHLLVKAYDLGLRLLPAFDTPTGIPHPRVHLQKGVVPIAGKNITETCSAGAGSLLVEFGTLSRLTNDWRFDKLARRACFKIWSKRNNQNLVGNGIDAMTGKLLDHFTGIGSGIDSYYECILKYAVLFNDKSMKQIWWDAYDAIQEYLFTGLFHHSVVFDSPHLKGASIDALGAFWAGVQVLAGEVTDAVRTHVGFLKLWNNWAGIPERWHMSLLSDAKSITLEWYLLRPEFIESTYYLYQATQDPLYLQTGQVALEDLYEYNKVDCGVAATQDVRTGLKSDRMDSFFLSETLKYLYLLFTPDHPLNRESTNMIFSTEAHPIWSNPQYLRQASFESFRYNLSTYNEPPKSILAWAYGLLQPWIERSYSHWPEPELSCEYLVEPGFSLANSWQDFYRLDEFITFVPPDWLKRKPIEFEHDFIHRYALSGAMCAVHNLTFADD